MIDRGASLRQWASTPWAWAAAAIVGVATVSSAAWTLWARPAQLGTSGADRFGFVDAVVEVTRLLPAWVTGSFVFPPKSWDDASTIPVAVWLAAVSALVFASLTRGSIVRMSALRGIVAWLALPAALVVSAMVSSGFSAWQGRYAYPLLVAALILAGASLSRRELGVRHGILAGALIAVAVTWSSSRLWSSSRAAIATGDNVAWPWVSSVPSWALGVLLLTGLLCLVVAAVPGDDGATAGLKSTAADSTLRLALPSTEGVVASRLRSPP
jgi:hypothetical protein